MKRDGVAIRWGCAEGDAIERTSCAGSMPSRVDPWFDRRVRIACVLVVLAACTERVQLGPNTGSLPGLVALDVTPKDTKVALVGLAAPPQAIAYTAMGMFVDGTSRDVTALVGWSTDDPYPGAFAMP